MYILYNTRNAYIAEQSVTANKTYEENWPRAAESTPKTATYTIMVHKKVNREKKNNNIKPFRRARRSHIIYFNSIIRTRHVIKYRIKPPE